MSIRKVNMARVLGFDISSSTIGWCVIQFDEKSKQIKFVKCGYLKPIKSGTIIERIAHTRTKIKKIIEDVKPDYIGIEDLIKFMPKSTASTVIVLATFNRMICLLAYDYLNKSPELLNVMTIRHGLKLNKQFPKKEDMPELVSNHLGIKFPYEYKKSGKPKEENCDMADGIAVALYYSYILTGKIKK